MGSLLLLFLSVRFALRVQCVFLQDSLEKLHVLRVVILETFIVNDCIKLFLEQAVGIVEVFDVVFTVTLGKV